MIIQCTSCRARFRFDETKLAGQSAKKVRCSKCGEVFNVLAPAQAKPAASEDPALASGAEHELAPPPDFASADELFERLDRLQPAPAPAKSQAAAAAPAPEPERPKPITLTDAESAQPGKKDAPGLVMSVAEFNAIHEAQVARVLSADSGGRGISLANLEEEDGSELRVNDGSAFGAGDTDQTEFLSQYFMKSNTAIGGGVELSGAGAAPKVKKAPVESKRPIAELHAELPQSAEPQVQQRINQEIYQDGQKRLQLSPLIKALREVEFASTDAIPALQLHGRAAGDKSATKTVRAQSGFKVRPYTGQHVAGQGTGPADFPRVAAHALRALILILFVVVLGLGLFMAAKGDRFNPTRISLNALTDLVVPANTVAPPSGDLSRSPTDARRL